ncbi:class I SAM-dependent methyltransferase [Patescibacteria group bacterium]|nr:class I SAM-dependent methyltransferase [Patescibacteria group bacterium]MDE1946431.1 class I SAM-dependent methyltransferase [Patescibacteria group bacterium]MDE2011040.1 class I SAM-dependent methyltransferase [Patescibacteria group bacterium]MDE2233630.1 class I SAM-dependent methyltransferase [Patescibacteria group bacterium]
MTESSENYELLDSGEGEKLERYGKVVLSRPDPQSLWRKRLDAKEWRKADGVFSRDENKGDWSLGKNVPARWPIDFAGMKFWIKPTPFKHTGIFPEQAANWEWLRNVIAENVTVPESADSGDIEILNLFGYTGGATMACARAGAKVVHVDGSKAAIAWARENMELSGLKDKPVRWILDDARTFVKREIKRGRKYAGIIMDPPAFGHGPDGELWKIEEDLLPLMESCFSLLAEKPLFFLINGYAAGYSAIAYENVLLPLIARFGGKVKKGELAIKESEMNGLDSRTLPCGIFGMWQAK